MQRESNDIDDTKRKTQRGPKKTNLNEIVEDGQGQEGSQEDGYGVADDEEGRDDARQRAEPDPQGDRDGHVEDVDVPREPVDDATLGGRVEEGHGGSEQGLEQGEVEVFGAPGT